MAKKLFTVDGVAAKIDERVFTDIRFVEMQCKATKPLPDINDVGNDEYSKLAYEQTQATLDMIEYVLGSEKNSVYEQLGKSNDGYVDIKKLGEWIGSVATQSNTGKK